MKTVRLLVLLFISVLMAYVGLSRAATTYFFGGCTTPPSGTTVTTVGPALVGCQPWTITAGGQIAVGGVVDPITANVIELAFVNGLFYQENSALNWWYKAWPGDSWHSTTNPFVPPTPPPTPGAFLHTFLVNNAATTVCPGSGTQAAPYCNIQNALTAALVGTDIRIQNTGVTYNESDTLSVSGTAANPIVIESDNSGSPPTLTNTVSTGNFSAQLTLAIGVSNVTVRNLAWDGTNLNVAEKAIDSLCSVTTSNQGIQILNNTFTNWGSSNTTIQYGTGMATVENSNPCNGTVVSGNTFTNSRTSAISSYGLTNGVITNNVVNGLVCGEYNSGGGTYSVKAEALADWCGDSGGITTNTLYQGNLIENHNATCPFFPNTGASYYEFSGIHEDGACNGGIMNQNVIHDINGPSENGTLIAKGLHIELHCVGWKLTNNLIYNNPGAGLFDGIEVDPQASSGANTVIAGNTIYNNGRFGVWANDHANVYDNIIYNNAYQMFSGTSCAGCLFDYNDYFGGNMGIWNGTIVSFATWKTSSGGDVHSLNTSPLLVAPASIPPSFLQTATSPTRSTGVVVSGLTLDYAGVTRPSPPSMGAYEYPN